MADFEPVLLRRILKKASPWLDAYRADGGYRALHKAVTRDDAGAGRSTPSRRPACAAAAGPAFPTGLKWTFLPKDHPGPDLPVRQRRRERALHVQQPHADGRGPAPGARRHHHRLLCHAGQHGLLLHALRIWPTAIAAMQQAIDEAVRRELLGQNILGKDFHLDVYHAPRGRRLHLRRRNRPDRKPGRQAGLAAHQAAVSGRRRRVPQADRRQQHRDAGLRDAHHRPRRRLVQVDGRAARPEEPARRRQLRPEAVLHQRPRQQARLRRSCRWASPCASWSTSTAAASGRAARPRAASPAASAWAS